MRTDTDRKARIAAIMIVVLAAAAIFGTATARLMRPRVEHVELDPQEYPVRGMDISAHNGVVDFRRAAADGIGFVFLKISEGETFRDAAFDDNFRLARQAGLPVGVYHYFRFDSEGWRQAANMLRTLGDRRVDLPLAVDVEEWGNAPTRSTNEVVEQLRSMVDYLHAWGYRVLLYSNKSGHQRFLRGNFDDGEVWICSFTDPPLPGGDDWHLWQHSHRGRVDGVPGPTDLNAFRGDSTAWQAWLRRGPFL